MDTKWEDIKWGDKQSKPQLPSEQEDHNKEHRLPLINIASVMTVVVIILVIVILLGLAG